LYTNIPSGQEKIVLFVLAFLMLGKLYLLQVGEALKTLFSAGVVQRGEMFITSKLWYVFGIWTNSYYDDEGKIIDLFFLNKAFDVYLRILNM